MRAPARLGLYGLVLVVVFAVAAVTAAAVVPESTVQRWTDESAATGHSAAGAVDSAGSERPASGMSSLGLGVAEGGYQLTGLTAPAGVGTDGELSLAITGPDGQAVTNFDVEHGQELHLISVRADGQHFRHVHPVMDTGGTWSIPWRWEAAGTYRVIADFVPAETGKGMTLSSSTQVGGSYIPSPAAPAATASVDGFDVGIAGGLVAGESTELTVTVSRDGQPVTTLEPYLGAFGHLVVLRQGDLAYLHAHPHGDGPQSGETSGPQIVFEVGAPTPGRYLLYLNFQVDGRVHTAPLVLDTTAGPGSMAGHDDGEHSNTGDAPEHGDDHDHG